MNGLRKGSVRRAHSEDVSAIVALIERNLDRLLPRTQSEVAAMIDCFWVAEVDDRVCGSVCLEVYSKKIAEVRSLVVDKDSRGLGLGQALVEAAVAEAERQNIYEVMVVTSSVGFFEKLNFGQVLKEKYALFYKGTKA